MKIGDRIMLLFPVEIRHFSPGDMGTIYAISSKYIFVRWDNGQSFVLEIGGKQRYEIYKRE